MSLYFNNGEKSVISEIEDNLGFNRGDISGNATRLAKYTGKSNIALDDALRIIHKAGGKHFDDANHPRYSIITMPIVSGQRDYAVMFDMQGNLVLDFKKVTRRVSTTGRYEEIYPLDPASERIDTDDFINGVDITGIPQAYDKEGNGILFDIIPNYNSPDGLKLYVSRESYYFIVTDTDRMPGFSGLFHEYIPLIVSAKEAAIKGLKNATRLANAAAQMKLDMEEHYGQKYKDERPVMESASSRINPRTGR